MKKLILPLLLLLSMYSMGWGANCGDVTVCACGDTVTSSYTFAGNLSCTNAGIALTVGANNITIDLNGFTLDGDDVNTTTGISNNGYTNLIIQNGTITDFTVEGIKFFGASTGTVNDVACNSMGNQGFQNMGTAVVTYNNVTANDNVDDGMSGHDDAVITINTGTFNNNAEGINVIHDVVITGTNLTLLGNTSKSIYLVDPDSSGAIGPTGTFTTVNANSQIMIGNKGLASFKGLYLHDVAGNHMFDTTYAGVARGVTITYSIFENIALTKYAVVIRAGVVPVIDNCIFANKVKTGNGVFAAENTTVRNSIFYNLTTGFLRSAGTAIALNCDFYGNTANTSGTVTLTNSILTDPLFVDPANSNYCLQSGSPAINAGVNVGLTSDYEGNSVPISQYPDIGAYEYQVGVTYYIRADGTAADKAAAVGPETNSSACMPITTHNSQTFGPGDIIIVSGLGGIYRTALKVPSDGTSGNLIEYRGSNNPVISGGSYVQPWTQYAGNVYYKSVTSHPGRLFYNEETELTSKSSTDLGLYEYYYQVGPPIYLYVNVGGDPGTTSIERCGISDLFSLYWTSTIAPASWAIVGAGPIYRAAYSATKIIKSFQPAAPSWVTSHAYVVGDFVTQSATVYYCLIAHTSGTFATDLAAGKWVAQAPLLKLNEGGYATLGEFEWDQEGDYVYIRLAGGGVPTSTVTVGRASDYIKINNLRITKSSSKNIIAYYGMSTGVVIENCHLDYAAQSCIISDTRQESGGGTHFGTTNWIVQNNIIHGNGKSVMDQGIYLKGINCIIQNNTIYDNWGFGIQIQYSGSTGNIIRYNKVTTAESDYGLGTKGPIAITDSSINNQIYYNLLIGGGHSIYHGLTSTGTLIYNNTMVEFYPVAGNKGSGLRIEGNSTISEFKNNIMWTTRTEVMNPRPLWMNTGSTIGTSNYNIFPTGEEAAYIIYNGTQYASLAAYQAATVHDANSSIADPLFRSSTNYHLRSSSPAINAGTNTPWIGVANVFDFYGRSITDGSGNIVALGGTVDIGAGGFQSGKTWVLKWGLIDGGMINSGMISE